MSNQQVEFLTKLRDGLTMASEAVNEYIDSLAPPEVREEKAVWSPERVIWKERTGQKGFFEVSEDGDSSDFKEMLRDILSHGGTITRDSFFYWSFPSGQAVGRKRRG